MGLTLRQKLYLKYRNVNGPGLILIPPSFLIIGAQKSGTTALLSYLGQHPQVKSPPEKELDFFSCSKHFELGIHHYHRHFRFFGGGSSTFSGEASPSYLNNAKAARRIHEYNPSMKLVCILRDPVDRAYSAFKMYQRKHAVNPKFYLDWVENCEGSDYSDGLSLRSKLSQYSFDEYVREEMEMAANGTPVEYEILSNGLYFDKLKKYYELFDESQICVVSSDELLSQPHATLKAICEFLELNIAASKNIQTPVVNKGAYVSSVKSPTRQLLMTYYRASNEQLHVLTRRAFTWTS